MQDCKVYYYLAVYYYHKGGITLHDTGYILYVITVLFLP